MRSSQRPPRTELPLSNKYQRRLNSYALAAAAAGVGALARAQSAEARIVYTPAHLVINTLNPQHFWPLDLNHDGAKDFSFSAYANTGMSSQKAYMRCSPQPGNDVWGRADESALRAGVRIGSHGRFGDGGGTMARAATYRGASHFQGPWANGGKGVRDRYLGFKFQIKGKTHYGWARLNVSARAQDGADIIATLTGYAYETTPNKAIIAGKTKGPDVVTVQPATLGHFAQGASAIPAWRVK
jgi:hypothetical protein